MSTRELIDVKPDGTRLYMDWDEVERKVRFLSVCDAEPVLEHNKRRTNNGRGLMPGHWAEHVATLDCITVYMLIRQGIWNDDKALFKWLDDNDYKKFKTTTARLA